MSRDKAFCVVQFIELPFEGIDDYVCVPHSWVIVRLNQKAAVAYPKDENPFDTRDRVKTKERYDDMWECYMATIKYESDTYWDAEYWIATRNDYGPLVEEESEIAHTRPRLTLNKEMRSANRSHSSKSNDNPQYPLLRNKRSALSEPKKQLDGKRLKLAKAAQSSSAFVNDANAEPGCSKRQQLMIIQDNQSMECAQREATAFTSHGESSSSQRTVTALSMPSLDVDTPTVAIDDDKEVQPANNMKQQLSSNQVIPKFMEMPKPTQGSQISVAPSMEITCNDQEPRTVEVLNNEPSSHYLLNSLKMSANPYSHISNQKPVEKTIRPMNISRNLAIAAQSPSNSMDQTGYLSTRSVKKKSSVVTQNQSQDGRRVLEMNTGNSTDQIASRRSIAISSEEIQNVPKINVKISHDMAAIDRRNVFQSRTNIAPASQNLSSSSRRTFFVHQSDGQQSSPTQEQYLTRSHQNQYLPTDQNNFELDLLRGSTDSNNYDHRLNSRPIRIMMPSIRQNTTNLSKAMYQTSEILQQRQSQPNQQDLQRQLQRSIGISIKPENNRQMSTLQGVTKKTLPTNQIKDLNLLRQSRSTIMKSHLNVIDNSFQTDECREEEPLSLYHAVTSDSNAVTDHEAIADHDMSPDETPFETTNNVYSTGIAFGRSSADRPTAAQNSTSTNHQTHPRVVLEQQMLDNFAILFIQMTSILRHTRDMHNNLLSSTLETAEIYKKLIVAVERFNHCRKFS